MTFYRWRTIKGKTYLYREERWRERGKVRSRSTLVKGEKRDLERKLANERYRDVLRENVYRYGKSHPGERYLREAQARADYHAFLNSERPESFKQQMEAMIERSRLKMAEEEAQAVQKAELAMDALEEKDFVPKGSPTDADEVARAEAQDYWHDWSSQQAAEYQAESENAPDVDAPSKS